MADIKTADISYNIDGGQATGYEAKPTGDGPFPGVVVIMEWWGLEPHIKDLTDRFAREGYHAVAPDIYHGTVIDYDNRDGAMGMARSLDKDLAVREIDGAASYIKGQSSSNNKVGIVGYCMGGGLVLATAIASNNIDAANVYYGGNPDPIDLVEQIQCPVLGLYAGSDETANPTKVPTLEEALTRFGKEHELHVYWDAQHSFFNDRRPSYHEETAKDAWQRTQDFFCKHLC